MPLTPDQLDSIRVNLDQALSFKDLARLDWKRQNDVIQQVFCVARFCSDLGPRAVLVDGHIGVAMLRRALAAKSVKQFFNRRCHDHGLKTRRIIIFDTVSTNDMGGRGNGKSRLHFHGFFELPEGWSKPQFLTKLEEIFGNGGSLGQRQFHLSKPDWSQFYSHNGVQVKGPVGKLLYGVKHAGGTYRVLELNEGGKRSRKAPAVRGSDNRHADGLAKGWASNFNKGIVFCDTLSKRLGKEAFEAWVKAERSRPDAGDLLLRALHGGPARRPKRAGGRKSKTATPKRKVG